MTSAAWSPSRAREALIAWARLVEDTDPDLRKMIAGLASIEHGGSELASPIALAKAVWSRPFMPVKGNPVAELLQLHVSVAPVVGQLRAPVDVASVMRVMEYEQRLGRVSSEHHDMWTADEMRLVAGVWEPVEDGLRTAFLDLATIEKRWPLLVDPEDGRPFWSSVIHRGPAP